MIERVLQRYNIYVYMYRYVFIRAKFVSDFLKFGSISGGLKFRVSVKAQNSFFLGKLR